MSNTDKHFRSEKTAGFRIILRTFQNTLELPGADSTTHRHFRVSDNGGGGPLCHRACSNSRPGGDAKSTSDEQELRLGRGVGSYKPGSLRSKVLGWDIYRLFLWILTSGSLVPLLNERIFLCYGTLGSFDWSQPQGAQWQETGSFIDSRYTHDSRRARTEITF